MFEASGSHPVQLRLKFLRLFVGELLNSRAVVVFLLLLLGLCQLGRSLGLLFPLLFHLHLFLFLGLLRELVVVLKRIFDELTREDRHAIQSVGWVVGRGDDDALYMGTALTFSGAPDSPPVKKSVLRRRKLKNVLTNCRWKSNLLAQCFDHVAVYIYPFLIVFTTRSFCFCFFPTPACFTL